MSSFQSLTFKGIKLQWMKLGMILKQLTLFWRRWVGLGATCTCSYPRPTPPSPFYPSFPYKKLLTTTEVHQVRWIIYILPLTKNPIIRKKIIFWIKREVNGGSFLYPLILTSFSGYRGTLRLRLSVSNYAYKPRESDLPVTQSRT